jgi:3-oxoadipate enol-lactonase
MRVQTSRGGFEVHTWGESGQPLLLLHPLALSGEVWQPAAQWWADAGRRVLALDARAHGSSDWDGKPFAIEDLADDVAAVLEALSLEGVDVLGMSMGGCTALALAVAHPHLVRRLVLADTTSCYGPGRQETWEERARAAESKPRDALIDFQLDRWFSEGFRSEHAGECRRVADIFRGTTGAAHGAASRAMGAFDQSGRLGEVRAQTLVLVGEEDYATPPAMAEVLATGIPGARLELLPATRHLSLVENRDAWRLVDHALGGNA